MMSAKRGMGPSGWAPRRTHAVGTTSSSTRDPKRALISSALRSFLGRRPGGQMRGVRLGLPTDDGCKEGPWMLDKKQKRKKSKRGNTSSAATANQAAAMCLVFACQIEPRNKRYKVSLPGHEVCLAR